MKHFDNLKLLTAVAMTLLPLAARALPFVPTTDPTLSTNNWYFLETDGFSVIALPEYSETDFIESPDASNDYHLWCFVGDEASGYRVYNKGLGKYLGLGTFHSADANINEEEYIHVEIENETDFHLRYDYLSTYYLIMRAYVDQYGTMRYFDISPWPMAPFHAVLAIAHKAYTRFDKDGVGYNFIGGGDGANPDESTDKLCDNDASTKFYGTLDNCWLWIEASEPVTVEQYSLVTAGDSRNYFDRTLRSWQLLGSNDETNWYLIDEQTDYPMPFDDQKEVIIKVRDTREFRYFMFMATNSIGANTQISEVWINEQAHNDIAVSYDEPHGCGHPITRHWQCNDCKVKGKYLLPPATAHNYVDGICTECGLAVGETMLLYNGQEHFPYYVKALHGVRNNDNWPSLPDNWSTVAYDDSDWIDLALPTASPGHSGGPLLNLQYNSNWYGQYNCYWIRRTFNLVRVHPDDIFTLHCVHDDNMVVYVNGQQVIDAQGWTPNADNCVWKNCYETFNIPASAFVAGENVLAIYMQQNWGGAYFDCDLRVKSGGVAGDVTGDGNVDIADVNAIINMMLGKKPQTAAGDATGDGNVDIADVNAVINIMLGRN